MVMRLWRELVKFGSIGVITFMIATGLSNALHSALHMGPLTSFAIAVMVATTVAYFANRYWTFKHRDRTGLRREYVLFFGLNAIGLAISELFIGALYPFGLERSVVAFNVAQLVGNAAATLFRYWSYKKWVFLPVATPAATPAATPMAGQRPSASTLSV
jgi:putative flippase GtrA